MSLAGARGLLLPQVSACRGLRSRTKPCVQGGKQAEKDGSPSSRPHSTLTSSREIKVLARLQVKPERLQEDGSSPALSLWRPRLWEAQAGQMVAVSTGKGPSQSGGAGSLEGEGPRGVFQALLQAQACPPSHLLPSGEQMERVG